MKQPPEQLPSLINQSVAARLLGYQSISPIKKLVSEKKLQTYKLPDSKRIMVDRFRWVPRSISEEAWKKSYIAPVRKEPTMEANNFTFWYALSHVDWCLCLKILA